MGGSGHFSHGQALGGSGWPWALGQPSWPVGLAAGGLLLSENLSAVRRSVDPERDRDDQVFGDDYFPVEE